MRGEGKFINHRFYNGNYISYLFGKKTAYLFKSWLDVNFKLITAQSKILFLNYCKQNQLSSSHLNRFCNVNFQFHHHRSQKKIDGLLYRFRKEALNIFYLHRHIWYLKNKLKNKLTYLSNYLRNQIPMYIFHGIVNKYNRHKHSIVWQPPQETI